MLSRTNPVYFEGKPSALVPNDSADSVIAASPRLKYTVESSACGALRPLIHSVGRLRRGMTAVIITPSLDPAWVRPLAALRTRGVACVVVTLDSAAYARHTAEADAAADGETLTVDVAADELAAKRTRALRHALAEYELRSYVITPGRALGEVLSR